MAQTPDTGHPDSCEFDYDFWFECDCGQRLRVPATTYDLQCQLAAPYPVCSCGTTIDIAQARPTVRDPFDIDHHDGSVDQHVWYHSSTYQDWPSPSYRHDVTVSLARTPLPSDRHSEMVDRKCSLALHLGTYAAAVENVLRRMADQDSPNHQYWLHQVEIQLQHGDLAPGVGSELNGSWGDVPATELTERGARAVRYVNTHEAIGSISLAIDPRVITRMRTIALPVATATLPPTAHGERAVTLAITDLEAAEQLRPDAADLPEDQVLTSDFDVFLAEATGEAVSDKGRAFARRMDRYHSRRYEIWASLKTALVDTYLPDMNPQVIDRFVGTAARIGDI